jgi:hypothetical protein
LPLPIYPDKQKTDTEPRRASHAGQKATSGAAALVAKRTLVKRRCPKSAKPDINCRDCDVRSLAGPEPDRQVFARFKYLLLKAAARSAETICVTIGEILRAFTPNAPSISETQAMPNPKSIML